MVRLSSALLGSPWLSSALLGSPWLSFHDRGVHLAQVQVHHAPQVPQVPRVPRNGRFPDLLTRDIIYLSQGLDTCLYYRL
jgi:hypothetical protein